MDNNFIIIDLASVDPDKTLRTIVNELLTRNKLVDQQKLPTEDKTVMKNNNNDSDVVSKVRKYFCNNLSCKKEITKEVVAFCLHPDNKDRFKGKVYCRSCQEKV